MTHLFFYDGTPLYYQLNKMIFKTFIWLVESLNCLERLHAELQFGMTITWQQLKYFFFCSYSCIPIWYLPCWNWESMFQVQARTAHVNFFFHPLFFFFKCRLSIRSSAVGLQRSSWLDGKESCEINLSSPSPLDYCLAFSNGTVIWEFLVANSRFIFHGFVMYSLVVGDMYHGPWLSSQ